MSFFSSTKDLPHPKQKPLGLDERRISTNEQARPVPYFCGIARLAVTFISEAFAVRSARIRMRVGKKKETVGYNYFASFAALIAHGPLDRLDAIWMDDELVWEGPLARSGDFADITIEDRGNVRLYWGTETQGQDPRVAAQPMLAGSMQVRKSKASGLTVGGLFSLSFPQSGVDGVLCRVERLTLPTPGQASATVQFREDTGFFNGDHYAAGADDPPAENVFEVQALAYEKLVEAPWGFKETAAPHVLFLAARGDQVSNGFRLWYQRSDASYRQIASFEAFAQRAHVMTEYPADTLLIDDYLGIEILFDSLDNDIIVI